jgi:hypothetical protein
MAEDSDEARCARIRAGQSRMIELHNLAREADAPLMWSAWVAVSDWAQRVSFWAERRAKAWWRR